MNYSILRKRSAKNVNKVRLVKEHACNVAPQILIVLF
jgi:hypothetical protein